jgi:hypothetical protein
MRCGLSLARSGERLGAYNFAIALLRSAPTHKTHETGGGCRSCAGARQPCKGTKRAAMGDLTGPMEVMVCASGGRERRGRAQFARFLVRKAGRWKDPPGSWQLRGPVRVLSVLSGRSTDSLPARIRGCNAWMRQQVLPLGVGDGGPKRRGRGPRARLKKREALVV